MPTPAIRVQRLSKCYRISPAQGALQYQTLRDALTEGLTGVWRRAPRPEDDSLVWALRDVSFDIPAGAVVGIIGRNGAGKSTLLKMMARITEPTSGRIEIRGRVASLLEVGTAFHPELTGRENIQLNAAILGMSRQEVRDRFTAIVEFAEIQRFIDTPVKRYSTGMRMRLAFSVAAHLEADVLLIDEVLAVGDAAFQAKCLGRMGEVASGGRTVLLVSHNLSSIGHLCGQSVLLDGGRLVLYGPTQQAIARYEGMAAGAGHRDLTLDCNHRGDGGLLLATVSILNNSGVVVSTVPSGASIRVVVGYVSERSFARLTFALSFNTLSGQALFLCSSEHDQRPGPVPTGPGSVTCCIDDLPLVEGTYSINISAVAGPTIVDWVGQAITVSVAGGDFFGNASGIPLGHSPFLVRSRWELAK